MMSLRSHALARYISVQDLGLEDPNWYGYTDYDVMIEEMLLYVHGVEDTSGEVVLRVPPESAGKVQAGLEDVAYYLHKVSPCIACRDQSAKRVVSAHRVFCLGSRRRYLPYAPACASSQVW